MKITNFFHIHRLYFYILACLMLVLSVFSCLFSQIDCYLILNRHIHCLLLDVFFLKITYLGDGVAVLIISLFFLWRRKYNLVMALLFSYLSSGLLAQLIKNLVHAPRPAAFLKNSGLMNLVEGVTCHMSNSFPSGHTTTAFAIAVVLLTYTTRYKKLFTLVLFVLATLVAYSRVYLGQHFPVDILAGAFLGTVCGVFTVFLFHYIWNYKTSLQGVKYELSNG